jgi:hypothetical protein
MYDPTTGDSTGSRVVQQDFSFLVKTPTEFVVTSSAPVTLFGTTALVTAQQELNSVTGQVRVNFTVMSDCGNVIAVTGLIGQSVGAIGAANAIILPGTSDPQPTVTKGAAAPSGTFQGLCSFTFNFNMTPQVTLTTCNINGGYQLTLNITFAGAKSDPPTPVTYPSALTSSNTCTQITNIHPTDPIISLQLYPNATDAAATAGALGTPGSTVLQAGATVSLGDTAHWRIVFPPTIGTPLITAWGLINVTWSVDNTFAISRNVSSAVKETTGALSDGADYGTTVAKSSTLIATDYSYFYFRFVWNANFTDHALTSGPAGPINNVHGGFSMPVLIRAVFTVTYAPTTRSAGARTELQSVTGRLQPRSGSPNTGSATSVGHQLQLPAGSTADSSGVALIASLASVASILLLAAIAFAIFLLVRRRRQKDKKAAAEAVPGASEEQLGFVDL